MDIIINLLFLLGGLALLWKSADLLVDGAVSLAEKLGISQLVIGLTIVAMGTSAPEVAASISAVLKGSGSMAIGNVYGSNIANLFLVGGIAALIMPIKVKSQTLKIQIPVMILVALLLYPMLSDLHISRLESVILLVVFISLLVAAIWTSKRSGRSIISMDTPAEVKKSTPKSILLIIAGLVGLVLGAKGTVDGAGFIGKEIFGLSDAVIGLTIVAVGTSLPELVTCIVASLKGHDDISIGNLVGSNIFNTLLVTGAAGVVRPFGIEAGLIQNYWVMIICSVVFAGVIIAGRKKLHRLPGLVLVIAYFAYMTYLFLSNNVAVVS